MKNLMMITILILGLTACKDNSHYNNYEQDEISAEPKVEGGEGMSNAIGLEVEDKRFKTTAQLQLKVKDVLTDAEVLEEKAIEWGGFVQNSALSNVELETKEVQISADSIQREVKMAKSNQLRIKVPTRHLRQYVKFALSNCIMIETITVENQEKTFEKLRNDLIHQNSSKLKVEDKIENEVAKAILGDDLKFATLNFHLSEEPHLEYYTVPQTTSSIHQEINLGLAFKNAWKEGVYVLKKILVGVIYLLPLLLGVLLIYLLFRFLIKYTKKRITK